MPARRTLTNDATILFSDGSPLEGEEELVPVGVLDLQGIVSPPGHLAGDRALGHLTPKIREPVGRQLDEQPRLVLARVVLAEDDLTIAASELTDAARAVTFVPLFLEAEQVDVEVQRALDVGDEEDRARVPPMSRLIGHGCLRCFFVRGLAPN